MRIDHRERDREILHRALLRLQNEIPVGNFEIKWGTPAGRDGAFDAVVRFERTLPECAVEIRRIINRDTLTVLEYLRNTADRTVVLVAEEVTEPVARELMGREIQFFDTLGNMFICQKDPFIKVFLAGNRPQEPAVKKTANPFTGTRLQVMFVLLTDENAVSYPYRRIADLAGVALGTVALTLKDLKRVGYLRTYRRGRKLMNREKLVNEWLEAYPGRLRPRLNPGRFTVKDENWWTLTDLNKFGAALGGETAAAVLTGHLRPEMGVLYLPGEINEAAAALRLKANPHGNLTIMKRFWAGENILVGNTPVAPPLIICAELLAEGGERNREAAEQVMKDHFFA